ncbi:Vacuolar protein sorting-associated protein 45 [Spathaspora sp. JA1]|nr:Vacuolar protein sorting-associated protein 45 [Spathaspora sp. JA1]
MTLNLTKVKDFYFNKLFKSTNNTPRVLLVDKFTTPIISICFSQSQLLQQDIILVELIEDQHGLSNNMRHLDCIVYINSGSIKHLVQELHSPHFHSYSIYTNNLISKNQLELIAEADEFEVIDKVVEIFQDYLIINENLFSVEVNSNQVNPTIEESNKLVSLLLSLKKTPIIKYESNSLDLKRLSSEILYGINTNSNNNLFDDLNKNSDIAPILLLLDRKNDPITPLITPWTYQSMIHEFMGIFKNIVSLKSEQPIILDSGMDKFFQQSRYLNYGDLTETFQKYVEEYKVQTKVSTGATSNLADLKKILTKVPEFKKLSSNILNHLNLLSEIDSQIQRQNLWEIGELQQTIICGLENHQAVRTRLNQVLDGNTTTTINKIKLVLLYSIRFHVDPQELSQLISKLNDPIRTTPLPTTSQIQLLKTFKTLVNVSTAATTNNNNTKKIINFKTLFNRDNAPSNDNIYLQYTPRLQEIITGLINPSEQPQSSVSGLSTLVPDKVKQQYGSSVQSVQDIIIYIKGGVTYEESRLIYELSQVNNVNLIIGGDVILNSEIWLNNLYDMMNEGVTVDEPVDRRALRELL